MQASDDAVSKGRLISQWVQKMKAGEISQAELIDIMRKQVGRRPNDPHIVQPAVTGPEQTDPAAPHTVEVDFSPRARPAGGGSGVSGLIDPEEDDKHVPIASANVQRSPRAAQAPQSDR